MPITKSNNSINSELSIALCTCEGSNFLPAQLDSLAGQTILPAEVVVCDDASTDGSLKILEEFAKEVPFKIRIYVNDVRLGTAKNFNRAISLCKGKYIALCDQDDIWLPERLKIVLKVMVEAEKKWGSSLPLLVHSDLQVMSAGGEVINSSYMKMRKINHIYSQPFRKLLAQNFVTGNTILFNRPLLDAALPVADEAVMHDWWLALVAAAQGKIIFIEQPEVLYRQHEHNVIGASGYISINSIKKVAKIKNLENAVVGAIKQAEALYIHLEKKNLHKPAWFGDYLTAVKKGRVPAIVAALRYKVFKQGLIRNILYLVVILKGNYTRQFD